MAMADQHGAGPRLLHNFRNKSPSFTIIALKDVCLVVQCFNLTVPNSHQKKHNQKKKFIYSQSYLTNCRRAEQAPPFNRP
jgi:hypothetical protein